MSWRGTEGLKVAHHLCIQAESRIEGNTGGFPGGFGNTDSADKPTKDGNYVDPWVALSGTGITACLVIVLLCSLLTALITGFLLLGYVNADSINEAHILISAFLAITSIFLAIAVAEARALSQTDFSGTNLDLAQIDRSSFQTAKTSGAAIERTTWL